jgi:hypothetical protein
MADQRMLFDRMAKEYEQGTWSGHGSVTLGPPRLFDEDMPAVTFRLTKSRIDAIDEVAAQRGITRSEFFREAIDAALAAAKQGA